MCALANQSVQEIAMFEIRQGDPRHGHGTNFPEPFWLPQLEHFMSGAGCDADIPPVLTCPRASVGPASSWTVSACERAANPNVTVGHLLDFGNSSTRTEGPHGGASDVQTNKRNRTERH